jgi:hypothetical protein
MAFFGTAPFDRMDKDYEKFEAIVYVSGLRYKMPAHS